MCAAVNKKIKGLLSPLLHQIESKNIAIVSGNSKHVISSKLAVHALAEKIACIFGAYEPGNKAQKIRNVCNYFGVDFKQSCLIGASASDIRYAKQAGVRSIAATWGWQDRNRLAKDQP